MTETTKPVVTQAAMQTAEKLANRMRGTFMPLDRPALLAAARYWWSQTMPSDCTNVVIAGDGRVDVYWQDKDESGKYTLPVDFARLAHSPSEPSVVSQDLVPVAEKPLPEWFAEGPIVDRLTGRAAFLRNRGEVKTPELLEEAVSAIEAAQIAARNEVLEEAAKACEALKTCGCDGKHGWCNADAPYDHAAAAIRALRTTGAQ